MSAKRVAGPAAVDPYSLMARFYDADYEAAGRVEDVAFYSSLAREVGEPVLEMGCGSGRNLLPIARSGIAIHGIDSSPAMLRALKTRVSAEPSQVRRRVHLTQGDIRTTRIGNRFGLVTAPFRVAQHLLDLADRRAWLRNVARHLKPSGLFCFDVLRPDPDLQFGPHEGAGVIERAVPGTNQVVVRSVSTRPRDDSGTLEVNYTWQIRSVGGAALEERRTTLKFHLYTRPELEVLLDEEGFQVHAYWGSFGREPFGADSTDHVILCRRRAG
jgi:SAM-dependent methyltransferase